MKFMSLWNSFKELYRGNLQIQKSFFDIFGFYVMIILGVYLIYYGFKEGKYDFLLIGLGLIVLALFLKFAYFPYLMKKLFPIMYSSKKK